MTRPGFPRSLPEFHRMFRDERDCFEFIVRSRWPEEGFRCPSCAGSTAFTPSERLVLVCAKCKHIQSATAGTVTPAQGGKSERPAQVGGPV